MSTLNKVYVGKYSTLITDHSLQKIKFSVRCCLRAKGTLSSALYYVFRDFGMTDQARHYATNIYNNGL